MAMKSTKPPARMMNSGMSIVIFNTAHSASRDITKSGEQAGHVLDHRVRGRRERNAAVIRPFGRQLFRLLIEPAIHFGALDPALYLYVFLRDRAGVKSVGKQGQRQHGSARQDKSVLHD